jgi:hypothetical protein
VAPSTVLNSASFPSTDAAVQACVNGATGLDNLFVIQIAGLYSCFGSNLSPTVTFTACTDINAGFYTSVT